MGRSETAVITLEAAREHFEEWRNHRRRQHRGELLRKLLLRGRRIHFYRTGWQGCGSFYGEFADPRVWLYVDKSKRCFSDSASQRFNRDMERRRPHRDHHHQRLLHCGR